MLVVWVHVSMVNGLWFMVQGLVFSLYDSGCSVQGVEITVLGLGIRAEAHGLLFRVMVYCLGLRIMGYGLNVQCLQFIVQFSCFRLSYLRFRV